MSFPRLGGGTRPGSIEVSRRPVGKAAPKCDFMDYIPALMLEFQSYTSHKDPLSLPSKFMTMALYDVEVKAVKAGHSISLLGQPYSGKSFIGVSRLNSKRV